MVGVVGDEKHLTLELVAPAKYYSLFDQEREVPLMDMLAFLVARTDGDARALVPDIRRALSRVDPNLPLDDVMTMNDVVFAATAVPRLRAALIGVLALVGLAVTTVGVYGVVSHHVARRRREIAVRMTLGAGAGDILRDVLFHGARLGIAGAGCGLALAVGLVRFGESQLYGVRQVDTIWLAGPFAIIVTATLCACLVPSRRAARVDPLETLRRP